MGEFELINTCFKSLTTARQDVVLGIGDDAACVNMPFGESLLVSTDTLVSGVHFFSDAHPKDIAWRSVAVSVSDLAAMAATPRWITLALTMPDSNAKWLSEFTQGLQQVLSEYQIALIGGDTTKGPLSITITAMGSAKANKIVQRSTARAGDKIYVSGQLGAAALAVKKLKDIIPEDQAQLMQKLMKPKARTDLIPFLKKYASSAIDISDGLAGDLNHLCEQSKTGASLFAPHIPIHPLLSYYLQDDALGLALTGGDDYEICFTIPKAAQAIFQEDIKATGLLCTCIGIMTPSQGICIFNKDGQPIDFKPGGYQHF